MKDLGFNRYQKMFDASLDYREVIIQASTVEDIELNKSHVFYLFNSFGFVILQFSKVKSNPKILLDLSSVFGNIVKHNRADSRGIVPVMVLPNYPDYLGASNLPHPLHTDSSFTAVPPKVMALQCEISSESGGLTKLVSCKAIYRYLCQSNPKGLESLFDSDAFAIRRDDQFAIRPIFFISGGLVGMAFRMNDGKANVSVKRNAEEAFNSIITFVEDPSNQVVFKLGVGQILIVDNYSVLHGRSGFDAGSPRKLNRVNFDGASKYFEELLFGFAA